MIRQDTIWKSDSLVKTFLEGVRGGIPFAAEQIEIMLRVIEARGEPVERFIDLGCGSGVLTQALLSRYSQATGVLVDFSEPMLEAARSQCSQQANQLSFVNQDFGDKGWISTVNHQAPFDVIMSAYAIHHQPDARKRELYAEIFDLLKPGGFFINIEHVISHSAWIETLSDEMMVDSLYAFHTQQGNGQGREQIKHDFVHRPDKVANLLSPVEDQCDWLREIGFQDVDCYFKVFELAVFGGRKPKGIEK
jgi:tRNA (cmo5U34)-methyltransferase